MCSPSKDTLKMVLVSKYRLFPVDSGDWLPAPCFSIFETGLGAPTGQREPGNLSFASRLLFDRRPNSYGCLLCSKSKHGQAHAFVCVGRYVYGFTCMCMRIVKMSILWVVLFTMIYVDLVWFTFLMWYITYIIYVWTDLYIYIHTYIYEYIYIISYYANFSLCI